MNTSHLVVLGNSIKAIFSNWGVDVWTNVNDVNVVGKNVKNIEFKYRYRACRSWKKVMRN